MKYLFFLAALALLLLSFTSFVMSIVCYRGIAHVMMWGVFALVSYGLVELANRERRDDTY